MNPRRRVSCTHQTLTPRINDRDQKRTDGEPSLGILHIKVPKRDDPHLLHDEHRSTTDDGLDGQEEEGHAEMMTRDDELQGEPFIEVIKAGGGEVRWLDDIH
jgi:hypothetical protein